MGRFKVYIKPFTEAGVYDSTWIDVSEDVELTGVSTIKQTLDNNEYDIGVFKNSEVTLTVTNLNGRYSNVGEPGTIFKHRRANSLVKITWEIMHHDLVCGFFTCGNVASSEEEIAFEGLLDDRALKQEAEDQNLKFKVLGKEAIFDEVLVPFADISAGDTLEEILFTILSEPEITELLTVAAMNIDCSVNPAVDSVAALENKTVKEALAIILRDANSVLYINPSDDTIYVSPRTASATVQKVFYGQGASAGIENIIDISDYRVGFNRVFNFVTWKDTTLVSQDLSSVSAYGYKKKEVSSEIITDNTKRQSILDSIKDEFKNPKRELILRVPIDYDTIALRVLDKISIDYPNVAINDSAPIPLWDLAVWDVAKYPYEVLPIAIEASAEFKILSRDIDPTNQELIFYVREV